MSATRPWVDAFADEMEAKLAENRHKGDRVGWASEAPHWLIERLLVEVDELVGTLEFEKNAQSDIRAAREMIAGAVNILRRWGPCLMAKGSKNTVGECADVANFAMMIADVAGGMAPRPDPKP